MSIYPVYPEPSPKAVELHAKLKAFVQDRVIPAEAAVRRHRETHPSHDHHVPPVIEELKAEAREQGLWNLFLPDE
jgi:acyl-CoA dehydrogenase